MAHSRWRRQASTAAAQWLPRLQAQRRSRQRRVRCHLPGRQRTRRTSELASRGGAFARQRTSVTVCATRHLPVKAREQPGPPISPLSSSLLFSKATCHAARLESSTSAPLPSVFSCSPTITHRRWRPPFWTAQSERLSLLDYQNQVRLLAIPNSVEVELTPTSSDRRIIEQGTRRAQSAATTGLWLGSLVGCTWVFRHRFMTGFRQMRTIRNTVRSAAERGEHDKERIREEARKALEADLPPSGAAGEEGSLTKVPGARFALRSLGIGLLSGFVGCVLALVRRFD